MELCSKLIPGLERVTAKSHALPVPIQVLTTFGFLATVSFQRELADRSGMSQAALSHAMLAVLNAILQLSARYLQYSFSTVQFAAIAGFPNVTRAIDCTHIAIKVPSEGEYAYVNRKHFVQIICDAQMHLTNIVARWPGATHDSFIMANSVIGNRLDAGRVHNGWLISKQLKTLSVNLLENIHPFV